MSTSGISISCRVAAQSYEQTGTNTVTWGDKYGESCSRRTKISDYTSYAQYYGYTGLDHYDTASSGTRCHLAHPTYNSCPLQAITYYLPGKYGFRYISGVSTCVPYPDFDSYLCPLGYGSSPTGYNDGAIFYWARCYAQSGTPAYKPASWFGCEVCSSTKSRCPGTSCTVAMSSRPYCKCTNNNTVCAYTSDCSFTHSTTPIMGYVTRTREVNYDKESGLFSHALGVPYPARNSGLYSTPADHAHHNKKEKIRLSFLFDTTHTLYVIVDIGYRFLLGLRIAHTRVCDPR